MEAMADQRRRLSELREEQRRLRQLDRKDNIERMLRAKRFHDDMLKEKFAADDEREAARKAAKAALVESHRTATLAAMQQRQHLIEQLARRPARLASSISLGSMAAEGGDHAPLISSSAPATPRPPSTPRPSRPSTAPRARLRGTG